MKNSNRNNVWGALEALDILYKFVSLYTNKKDIIDLIIFTGNNGIILWMVLNDWSGNLSCANSYLCILFLSSPQTDDFSSNVTEQSWAFIKHPQMLFPASI